MFTVRPFGHQWAVHDPSGALYSILPSENQARAAALLANIAEAAARRVIGAGSVLATVFSGAASLGRTIGGGAIALGAGIGAAVSPVIRAGAAIGRQGYQAGRQGIAAAASGTRRVGSAVYGGLARSIADVNRAFASLARGSNTLFQSFTRATAHFGRRVGQSFAGSRVGRGLTRAGQAIGRGAVALGRRAAPHIRRIGSAIGAGASQGLAALGLAASRVGLAFGSVVSAVIPIIGSFLAFGGAELAAIVAATRFGETMVRANRELAQFNGRVAAAYARLEIGDLFRKLDLSSRTAPSTEALTEAVNRMRDSFVSFDVARTQLGNAFGIASAQVMEALGRALAPLADMVTMAAESGALLRSIEILLFPLTISLELMADTTKAIYEWLTGKPWVAANRDPNALRWDNFVGDILRGRLGGPLLPRGPLAIPGGSAPLMDISYNGISFAIVKTEELSFTPVMSDDGTTYLYTRVYISVQGIINPDAMAYVLVDGSPDYVPGSIPPYTTLAIRHALEQPRAQLIISSATGDMLSPSFDVIESPVEGYPCDLNNGPKPGPCKITSVSGAKTWVVNWSCETWIHECPNEDSILELPLISNRYSRTDQLDEQYKSTFVTTGVAVFRTDILEENGWVADDFRDQILPPVPLGCIRRRINVTAVPNRNALQWSCTDQELMFDLGDTTASGSYITDVEGTYGISTVSTSSGFPNGQSLGQLFVRVKGTKQASNWILTQRCIGIAASKIPFGSNINTGYLQQLSVNQSLVDREVSVNVVWKFLPPKVALQFLGAMDINSLQVDAVFADQGGVNPSPPWGGGTQGTSQLKLLVASLEDACSGAAVPPCNQPGPVGGGATQCGPPPAVVVSTATELTPFQPSYTPNQYPYNLYNMNTKYFRRSNILMAPVASPSQSNSTGSSSLNSLGNAPTAAFFQLAQPTSTVVVEWQCERVGQPPQIPDPNTDNDNYVLLNYEITPTAPQIISDAVTVVYAVSGRYEFGAVTAMGLNDSLGMGILPWIAADFTDFEVSEEDYTQGLIDGGEENFA